jgi:hypothetical protein
VSVLPQTITAVQNLLESVPTAEMTAGLDITPEQRPFFEAMDVASAAFVEAGDAYVNSLRDLTIEMIDCSR